MTKRELFAKVEETEWAALRRWPGSDVVGRPIHRVEIFDHPIAFLLNGDRIVAMPTDESATPELLRQSELVHTFADLAEYLDEHGNGGRESPGGAWCSFAGNDEVEVRGLSIRRSDLEWMLRAMDARQVYEE